MKICIAEDAKNIHAKRKSGVFTDSANKESIGLVNAKENRTMNPKIVIDANLGITPLSMFILFSPRH